MPRPTAARIVAKIEAYAADPASQANNVKALKGEDAIRLRVGEWRVIMLDGEVLDIVRIAPRGDVYG
jgi:mRNA interferase RelE/StbE